MRITSAPLTRTSAALQSRLEDIVLPPPLSEAQEFEKACRRRKGSGGRSCMVDAFQRSGFPSTVLLLQPMPPTLLHFRDTCGSHRATAGPRSSSRDWNSVNKYFWFAWDPRELRAWCKHACCTAGTCRCSPLRRDPDGVLSAAHAVRALRTDRVGSGPKRRRAAVDERRTHSSAEFEAWVREFAAVQARVRVGESALPNRARLHWQWRVAAVNLRMTLPVLARDFLSEQLPNCFSACHAHYSVRPGQFRPFA